MIQAGDAAEQIVRLSLAGVEVAARITGTAAKEIATFLVAAIRSDNKRLKSRGQARMASMLKSGKALEIYTVRERDLKKFMQGAKQYGIVYAVLRSKKRDKDGMCDILVKAEDAPKISRIAERFKFATVDKAKIESDIIRDKAGKAQGAEPEAPDKNDTEKLLDELLGTDEGKAAPEKPPEPNKPDVSKATPQNPTKAKTEKSPPSAPTSESRSKSAGGTLNKPSVIDELREIKAARAKQEADAPKRDERQAAEKPGANASTVHRQPPRRGRSKSKKSKAR
jgi:hypothetical protein